MNRQQIDQVLAEALTKQGKDMREAMYAHDEEIGKKTAILLAKFHQDWVAPLEHRVEWMERRVAYLELPWHQRARAWWQRQVRERNPERDPGQEVDDNSGE